MSLPDRIIRDPEACTIAGCSKSTLRRRELEGLLPPRMKTGPNSSGRWLSEFMAALKQLPRARDVPTPPGPEHALAALAAKREAEKGRPKQSAPTSPVFVEDAALLDKDELRRLVKMAGMFSLGDIAGKLGCTIPTLDRQIDTRKLPAPRRRALAKLVAQLRHVERVAVRSADQ